MATPWIRIQSALLAAVLTTALAVHLLLRRPARRIYQEYAVFALNLALWFLADALYALFDLSSIVLDTVRLLVATGIPVTLVRFFRALLEDESALGRTLHRGLAALGVAAALLVIVVVPSPELFPSAVATTALMVYIFGGVYACHLLIGQRLRKTQSAPERGRLKSLLVAGLASVSLILLDYLPNVGYYFFGNIFVMLFLYFLFQIITKLRLLDLYEFLGRSVVMMTFALVIASIFLFLTAFWRDRGDLFVFNTVIAALVVIILFEPLSKAVGNWISQFLFSERFAFTSRLEALQAELATVTDASALAVRITETLDMSRRVTHASVYYLSPSGRSFDMATYVGANPKKSLDVAQDRPLLEILEQDHIVTLEGIEDELKALRHLDTPEAQARRERLGPVKQTLEEIYAAVVIACHSGDSLLGILAVNDDRLPEPYSTDEISMLHKVATQAAIALENSRVYDKLRERDRLAALGEMSAGLAHEIRNPLSAIKGAAQLLADAEYAEGARDFASVISDEVDRLNTVVTQFLHFAKPYRGQLEEVDLNEIVEKTLNLLQARTPEGIEVRAELAEHIPAVWTDPEMVQTIFLNLAINAIEAMEGTVGTLTVRTLGGRAVRQVGPVRGPMVLVQFQDTGPGIARDQLSQVFIPFFTTKSHGTGLGLSICQRIVKGLGGFIEVQSETGRGTTFTLFLPASGRITTEAGIPTLT